MPNPNSRYLITATTALAYVQGSGHAAAGGNGPNPYELHTPERSEWWNGFYRYRMLLKRIVEKWAVDASHEAFTLEQHRPNRLSGISV